VTRPDSADPLDSALASECDTLCRYLTGREAPAEVIEHYVRAHELGLLEGQAASGAPSRSDRLLVLLAQGGPQSAGLADAISVLIAKKGLLRRKLVLLLAILESARSTWRGVDTVEETSPARFFFGAALAGSGFVLRAAAGLAALGVLALAEPLLSRSAAEDAAS